MTTRRLRQASPSSVLNSVGDAFDDGPAPVSPRRGPRPKNFWSRTASKYRLRAAILLAVNVLLFSGVGCFAYWLRSGVVFAPATESYVDELVQSMRFGKHSVVSLASFLTSPINVQDVPMLIPIMGLLMAALLSIPILVAILYRFWSSLPFIAVVGLLGMMPWLAITLLFSCILAAARPFRTRFRFTSALLGLTPAVIYLMLAWRGSAEILAGRIDPVDRIKFIAPWVLAIVAATAAFAIVLTIAKMVDYRPGAIAPLLAVMFGLPIGLFEFHVGRDELSYRLLEEQDRASFTDADASLSLEQAAFRMWERQPLPRPSWRAIRESEELKWQFLVASDLGPYESELTRHQYELAGRCDRFHRDFPTSRYVLNALFLKARALDRRVDAEEFRATRWIRFYDDFPSEASRATWTLITANDERSLLKAVALLRLAQLEARAGDVSRALDRLTLCIETATGVESPQPRADHGGDLPAAIQNVLERNTPENNLGLVRDGVLIDAHQLRDLLRENRDPLYGFDPLAGSARPDAPIWFGLLDLDRRDADYARNLRALLAAYPNCQITDNIELELAKTISAVEQRVEALERCVRAFPDRDAAPEALFRLAVAYRQDGRREDGEAAFRRLLAEFPNAVWARQVPRRERDLRVSLYTRGNP